MFIFGHLQGLSTQRLIYDYFARHWREWFPLLPSYQAFNRRLHLLMSAFELLIEDVLMTVAKREDLAAADRLIDSFASYDSPRQSRKSRPRCSKTGRRRLLCDQANPLSRRKVHIVAARRVSRLPMPERGFAKKVY